MSTTPKRTVFHLYPSDALLLATVTRAHISTDDVTPVLTGAALRIHDGKVEAISTDRYTVARVRVPNITPDKEQPGTGEESAKWTLASVDHVIVPRHVLDWVKANAAKFKAQTDLVRISLSESKHEVTGKTAVEISVTVSDIYGIDELSIRSATIAGNHPPVGKLIDEHKAGAATSLSFDPELLRRAQAGIDRREPVEFVFGEPSGNGIPGPALFKATRHGRDIVGLIQPTRLR